MTVFHADCRHFTGEKPCAPHKNQGVVCRDCPRYERRSERVLIVKLDAAGDVLRSTCILPALRRRHPKAALWWVTDPASRPLLAGHPDLDGIFGTDASLPGLLTAVRFVRVYNFDMSRRAAAILQQSRARTRTGYGLSREGAVVPLNREARAWYEMGLLDPAKRANRKTYQEHLFSIAGLRYQGEKPRLFLEERERARAEAFAAKQRLGRFRRLLGFNIGAGGRWAMKRWRLEGFAELARMVKRRLPGVGILAYGGPEEREAMPTLVRLTRGAVIPTGTDNSLRDFAARVGLCDVLVTGDTLALHVAVALERRVVAYFGPTADSEIDLYGRGEKVLPPEPCRCFYRPDCVQKVSCMDRLDAGRMFQAVERQLKARSEASW